MTIRPQCYASSLQSDLALIMRALDEIFAQGSGLHRSESDPLREELRERADQLDAR